MRIMSLNGWGGKLHELLIAYLREASPDILCLQEVVHTPSSDKDWLTYRDAHRVLPQRANLFREVAAALPDHAAIYCPAAEGVLWDDDVSVPSQWGLATFVRESLPLIGQAQGFVHKDFSANGYGEHPRPRPGHAVRVYDREGQRTVTVAQMHGTWHPGGKMDTPERAAQAHRLVELTRSVTHAGDQLVVCGDFNVEPGSETLRILGELGVIDLIAAHGVTDTRTSHYEKPGRFADYMMVGKDIDVLAFEAVAEPEVSDHRPLVLEI